ncbi:TetR family transcriptional regulator [Streptomyces kronopolitis]|uniref:TetR family transcriptional regulator n=1 Tax=Streptomyces kronopolitis TaxID=1612435 RepID=A0ABQ2K4F7_9ACTN|nr:TetR/AcrR family transcriptional regulator [Streptomyces kronopolitis]GGN62772.1 TetR family transcriptional regulator [Streptomyces kronopolitis]
MAGRKQFDVDEAVRRAMAVFWQRGYADTSLDLLGAATGLGRGSLYGTFGGKDSLFRRCLDRYAATYGDRYDRALTSHPDDPGRAIEAFFDVTLDRLADRSVPDGCLLAQSATQSATLHPETRSHVQALLADQRARVRAALTTPGADSRALDDLATYVVAVTQSLAVLSRAGTPLPDLRAVTRLARTTVSTALAQANTGHATT